MTTMRRNIAAAGLSCMIAHNAVSAASDEASALPDKAIRDALSETEKLFGNVGDWLMAMYDPASGGFHYTHSGRADPKIGVYIESTAQAVGTLRRMGAIDSMPDDIRARLVAFFQDRQDPATGFFLDDDPRMRASTRLRGRALSFAIGALGILEAEPAHNLPAADGVADTLPDQMKSPEAMRRWVATRNWKSGWGAACDLSGQAMILRRLPEGIREPLADALLAEAASRQGEDGFYGGGDAYVRMSGALKMLSVYTALDRKMPRADAVYASTLQCLRADPSDMCFVYNALKLFLGTRDEATATSPNDTFLMIGFVTRHLRRFRKPDGAFSRSPKSATGSLRSEAGANVPVGHGRYESDMDATALAGAIRHDLYHLAGMPVPVPLAPDQFWEGIRLRIGAESLPP